MQKNTIVLVIAILFNLSVNVNAIADDAAGVKEIRLAVHFTSSVGVGAAQTFAITNSISRIFEKQYGYRFTVEKYPSYTESQKVFFNGEAEATYLGYEKDMNTDFWPFANFTIGGRGKLRYCFWDQKQSPVTKISDLYNKTVISGMSYYSQNHYLMIRDLLAENNIDEPLWKIFDGFIKVNGRNSAIMAHMSNKTDLYWGNEEDALAMKVMNPVVAAKMNRSFCTVEEFGPRILVLNKKLVSREEYKKIINALKDFIERFEEYKDTDPTLKSAYKLIQMADGRIDIPGKNHFEEYERLFEKAEKNSWLEEAEFFVQVMQDATMGELVKIKPDMEYCKKKCGAENPACIVKCLE